MMQSHEEKYMRLETLVDAANERIRELEAELAEWKGKGSRGQIAQWRTDSIALTTERAISDKMEKALKDLTEEFVRVFPIYYYSGSWALENNSVWNSARTAIAEVATIRKGEQG